MDSAMARGVWISLILSAGLLLAGPLHAWGSDQAAGLAQELNAACACSFYTAEMIENQRNTLGPGNKMGFGSLRSGNLLAQAIAQKNGLTLEDSTAQVFAARLTMGWGAIANANGLKLGKDVLGKSGKAANAGQQATTSSTEKTGKSDEADKGGKGGGPDVAADRGSSGGGGHGGGGSGGGGGGGGKK